MRGSFLRLIGIAGLLTALAAPAQAGQDFGVLIISRERLEVPTSCEIGVYLQDQLAARLFQEQSTSFNLPPGQFSVRLRILPGAIPGCDAGIEQQSISTVSIRAGDILKYRIASSANGGMYLRKAELNY